MSKNELISYFAVEGIENFNFYKLSNQYEKLDGKLLDATLVYSANYGNVRFVATNGTLLDSVGAEKVEA